MFLNLKKHILIIIKKKGVRLEFNFPEENLCQGKILILSHQRYIFSLCVAINLLASVAVKFFVSSVKW